MSFSTAKRCRRCLHGHKFRLAQQLQHGALNSPLLPPICSATLRNRRHSRNLLGAPPAAAAAGTATAATAAATAALVMQSLQFRRSSASINRCDVLSKGKGGGSRCRWQQGCLRMTKNGQDGGRRRKSSKLLGGGYKKGLYFDRVEEYVLIPMLFRLNPGLFSSNFLAFFCPSGCLREQVLENAP